MRRCVMVEYPGGDRPKTHSYKETYEQTDWFCPGCGKQGLWEEDGPGDYYVGENWVCTGCAMVFTMQAGVPDSKNEQDQQRVAALRVVAEYNT